MNKVIVCVLLFCVPSFASNHKPHFRGGKLGHATKAITIKTVVGTFDTIEAAFDGLGMPLQAAGAGLLKAGGFLEKVPYKGQATAIKVVTAPIYYTGETFDYTGTGINRFGVWVAK